MKKMIFIFIATSFIFNSYCTIYSLHGSDVIEKIDYRFNLNSTLELFYKKYQDYFYILLYVFSLGITLILSFSILYKNILIYKIFKEILYYFFSIATWFMLIYLFFIGNLLLSYIFNISFNLSNLTIYGVSITKLIYYSPIVSLIYILFRIIYKYNYNFNNLISKLLQLINKFYEKIYGNRILIIFSLFFIFINFVFIYSTFIKNITTLDLLLNPKDIIEINYYKELKNILNIVIILSFLVILICEIYYLFNNKQFVLSKKFKEIYYHFLTISFWYSIQFPYSILAFYYALGHRSSSLICKFYFEFCLSLIWTTPIISLVFLLFRKKYRYIRMKNS